MNLNAKKLADSQHRLNEAIRKIFDRDPNYTGQFDLECQCKDGVIRDVYEKRSRRKV